MNMSLTRPTICKQPLSVSWPTSPVLSHPSRESVLAVASGSSRYSSMTLALRTTISPASPSGTSLPSRSTRRSSNVGRGRPTIVAIANGVRLGDAGLEPEHVDVRVDLEIAIARLQADHGGPVAGDEQRPAVGRHRTFRDTRRA